VEDAVIVIVGKGGVTRKNRHRVARYLDTGVPNFAAVERDKVLAGLKHDAIHFVGLTSLGQTKAECGEASGGAEAPTSDVTEAIQPHRHCTWRRTGIPHATASAYKTAKAENEIN